MKRLVVIVLMLAMTLASLKASVLFSESFNYPDGGIVANSAGVWINNSGTAGSMVVSNDALIVSTSRSEDIAHQFSSTIASNGPITALYASMKITFTGLPTQSGTYFTHFAGDAITFFKARTWAATTNVNGASVAPPGFFYLGVGNNTPSSSTLLGPGNGQFPTPVTTNVTYTLVLRYVLATGISTIWVDANSSAMTEGGTSATADDAATLGNINYFGFRQSTGEGTMEIDDLKIGTQFADVAGANTAPSISAIPSQSIPRDGSTAALPFTVGDAESNPSSLTVGKASTNLTLVPLTGVVINNGDGTNRTVTVTPAAGQQGRSLITLTVNDGGNTADSSFVVTVGAPTISPIPNQIAKVNVAIPPIPFTVTDAEGDSFTYTVSSSNTNILKNANITINGTGSSRTVTLVPEANTNGFTTVTLSFNDGFNSASESFGLTISPQLGVLLQDQFTYTSFVLPNAVYQATDSPWQTVSGTPYELQSTNGWAYINSVLSEDLGAPLTNAAGIFPNFTNYASSEGVVFYSSFTLKVTTLPKFSGDYFAHLKSSYNSTTFRAKVFVATNGAASGTYRIGIANQANAGTYFPLDCNPDTDYLVVTRYNSSVGEATLWVNPTSEAGASVSGADAPQTTPIGGYGLRQTGGTSSIGDAGNLQISNLVVSTSFPNLPVVPNDPMTITSISLAGSTVTINFNAGASDTSASFDLYSAGTVNGTYGPAAGSSISTVGVGQFKATVPTSGSAQFYRIHRP